MSPGGSGDPFAGLDTHQREELATLYRLGYPRGDELMIAQPMGQIWLWASMAERLLAEYPDYFESFWTKPGYVGHDLPSVVEADLIDVRATVQRVLFASDIIKDSAFNSPEFAAAAGDGGPVLGSGRATCQWRWRSPTFPTVTDWARESGCSRAAVRDASCTA